MWLQRFTNFLLQNFWRAIALTFAITFVPIFGIIGILIAGLMTLLKGPKIGAVFTLAATLPYVATFLFANGPDQTLLVGLAAVGVAVLSNVLTWVFGVMLYRKTSWSTLIQIAVLVGVLAICLIHVAYPNVVEWWGVQLTAYYDQARSVAHYIQGAPTPTLPDPAMVEGQRKVIEVSKQYATGLIVTGILFNAIMQLIVARWWQATIFQPGILRRELRNIRLSNLAGTLFVVSLVFCYLDNSVVIDIMPVLYMLFVSAGLSVVHYYFGMMRTPMVWFWLVLIYVTLIIAAPSSFMMISVIALLDIWFDLRKRIKKV